MPNQILSFREHDIDGFTLRADQTGVFQNSQHQDLDEATLSVVGGRTCTHCGTRLAVLSATDPIDSEWRYSHHIRVGLCSHCGFWFEHWVTNTRFRAEEVAFIGRLRKFPADDIMAPLSDVVRHVATRHEDIYSLHPRKFEELVTAMLIERWQCTAEMTKASRDGGIDIICIDSERGKRLVQVKRYAKHRKVTVGVVRELAGVLLLNNERNGMIVTSSEFTADACQEAAVYSDKRQQHPIQMDLCSIRDVVAWLDLVRDRTAFDILDVPHIGDTLRRIRNVEGRHQGIRYRPEGYVTGDVETKFGQYVREVGSGRSAFA